MSVRELVFDRLNVLTNIMLTKGVQPSDLADNIFLNEYISISLYKTNNSILCKIELVNNIFLHYRYTIDRELLSICEIINGVTQTLWDRETRECELLEDIINLAKLCYSEKQLNSFIDTLPLHLKDKILLAINVEIA